MRTKAQIKMFESIGVLLVFFFLIGMGLQFYGNVQMQDLDRAKREFSEITSIEVASKMLNFPTLFCTRLNVKIASCVDALKAQIWQDNLHTIDGFRSIMVDQLPPSTIWVREVYPQRENEWVIYNDTPQIADDQRLAFIDTMIPITIFHPAENRRTFGIMVVRLYQ